MLDHYVLPKFEKVEHCLDGDIGRLTFTDAKGNTLDITYYGSKELHHIIKGLKDVTKEMEDCLYSMF